jgi:hypothetical protein
MILLWFKIIGYKIYKMITKEPSKRADTGAEITVPRAHVSCDHCLHEAHDRSCAECGCTARPDPYGLDPSSDAVWTPNGDAGVHVGLDPSTRNGLAVQAWHEEWARREAGDPASCPCGGRHYPSAGACRWCRCHDSRNVHHTEGARGIMQTIKPLTEDQERIAADARRVFGDLMDEARERFPGLEMITPEGVQAEIMDSSPADEIVVCPGCGHPDHGAGDGRCAFQVPSRMQDEGFHTCRCRYVAGSYRLEDAP